MTNSSECSNDLKIENGMARCSLFTGELPKDLYIPGQIMDNGNVCLSDGYDCSGRGPSIRR